MRQVFVKNGASSVLEPVDTTAQSVAASFGDLSSGEVGCWNLDKWGYGGWHTSALYQKTIEAGTASDISDAVTLGQPLWLVNRLQFAQGYGSGNPIATPIISTGNILRINYEPYADTTQMKHVIGGTGATAGDDITFRFVVRTAPTSYLDFSDPSNAINDLSGDGKIFPLGAFNTTNHKIIDLELTNASATLATMLLDLKSKVEAHGLLGNILKVSTTSTANDTLTVRHAGVIVDLIVGESSDISVTPGDLTVNTTQYDPGTGNDWQVLSDEKSARGLAGNFNRMYFPQSFTQFATTGSTYDKVTVTYKIDGDRDVVKGSQFGELVIYDDNQSAGTGGLEDIFGYTNGTAAEYRFA